MIDYEKELNPEQYRVVMEEGGPLLVLAGAGSGVRQENILLATFTNKAAHAMLNRVESLIHSDTRNIMGGTFHHIAHLFLRRHAHYIGYKCRRQIGQDVFFGYFAAARTVGIFADERRINGLRGLARADTGTRRTA